MRNVASTVSSFEYEWDHLAEWISFSVFRRGGRSASRDLGHTMLHSPCGSMLGEDETMASDQVASSDSLNNATFTLAGSGHCF